MSLRNHRILAVSILVTGLVVVVVWGRSMTIDPPEIQSIRDQLQGRWVASLIESNDRIKREGKDAEVCQVVFDGKTAKFLQLVHKVDARGTYFLERPTTPTGPAKIDFKLDAGWVIGLYELKGDTLTLVVNPFSLPERLGVPTRPRPWQLHSGDDHLLYVFRKVADKP